MSDRKFYIRRGNKAIGPLTLERLRELQQQGSLQSDSIIGESSSGPWLPLEKILETHSPIPQANSSSLQQDNSTSSFDLSNLDLGSNIPPIPASIATSTFWDQPNLKPIKAKASTNNSKNKKLTKPTETPWYIRAVAPWVGENERGRYGNLERYIEIYRTVSVICFILGFAALTLLFFFGELAAILKMLVLIRGDRGGAGSFGPIPDWLFTSIFFLIAYPIGLLVLHLLYIVSMAFIDFFRLMIDLEGNTRKVAEYAESETGS